MSVQTVDLGGLTATEARALTDEIRQTLKVGHDLIIRAFAGRAWSALGYETWDAYCAGEFNDARMVRLDREQRREIVAEMRQAGMSTRAIASGIGVAPDTVSRDLRDDRLSDVGQSTPATVTSLDGRQRPATQPRPPANVDIVTGEITDEPAARPAPQRQASRRALPDFARDAGWELRQAIERVERVLADDRYPQNAEQVTSALRGHLLYAAESVANALGQLSN